MMQYTPEYDETVSKTRIISETVEWLRKTSDDMSAEGMMNYALSFRRWADLLERAI